MTAILALGGGALAVVAGLGVVAEVAIRKMRRVDKGRVAAWERAELERVGPEIYHGQAETEPAQE